MDGVSSQFFYIKIIFITVSPDICGTPLILNGNIQPLQPQYETGKTVAISCNQNYSFIDDTTMMTIQCQGYNLWNPPAQLCFCKYKFRCEVFSSIASNAII